jgi:hypothetical protein
VFTPPLSALIADVGRDQTFDRSGHAGDQSAAAYRYDHHVHVVDLVEQLQSDRALAGDDSSIVVGRHEDQASGGGQIMGMRHDLVRMPEHHGCTKSPRAVDLDGGSCLGHHHRRSDARPLSRVGRGTAVVAGGVGHDANRAPGLPEHRDGVRGAAEFERTGALKRFGLDPYKRTVRRMGYRQGRRARAGPADAGRCLVQFLRCHQIRRRWAGLVHVSHRLLLACGGEGSEAVVRDYCAGGVAGAV